MCKMLHAENVVDFAQKMTPSNLFPRHVFIAVAWMSDLWASFG